MIEYRIYRNDGAGGPVDYSAPIATVSALGYRADPIPPGSDVTFAVRARDAATGLEERNTDATARIATDAAGADRTHRPASPVGLTVRATAGGRAKVEWFQPGAARKEEAPTEFRVYLAAEPGPIDFAAPPSATRPGWDNQPFSAEVEGLADGSGYLVAVRAANASGDDGNSAAATVVGSTRGPLPVENLSASLS